MKQDLSNIYVNPKGKLYKDIKYPNEVSVPLDGVKEFTISKEAIEYFIKSKNSGLLLNNNCNITDKRLDFYTE